MKYAKGIMWLDDCRIPFVDEGSPNIRIVKNTHKKKFEEVIEPFNFKQDYIPDTKGRFTPNLLVCDDLLNDGTITKQSKRTYKPTEHKGSLFGNSSQGHGEGIGDSGSSSRYYDLDMWFDKMIEKL